MSSVWCLPLAIVLVTGGCRESGDYQVIEGATMGTYYRITSQCPPAAGKPLADEVAAELDTVNLEMSTYLQSSELSEFNRAPVDSWIEVSSALVDVVATAQAIASDSDGAFDVTVGPLINLWGFGPAGRVLEAPSPDEIAAARKRVGWAYLESRSSPPALKKTRSIEVDLSAIAKGHGVDRVANLLDGLGCTDFLVDIGGEVRGRGVNEAGLVWRIGIEVPDPSRVGAVQRVLKLPDVAVATSGDYRNFMDLGGERFSHTMDPRTGQPVRHGLASVSVIHTSAMWADGLATALNVLGPEAGFELASRQGFAVLFLVRQAGGFEERYTPAMQNFLESQQ